jgi:hypothetical protein
VGWAAAAELQAGIISRRQLMELGLSRMQAKAYINNGRWQRMLPGVYATFTGPVGTFCRVWAAILYAGPGAAASHGTALWLWKVIDDPPTVIDVIVPELRKVLRQRGLRGHRRRALNQGPPTCTWCFGPRSVGVRLRNGYVARSANEDGNGGEACCWRYWPAAR